MQVLEDMRGAVEAQAGEAGWLLRLRGHVEHLRGEAPYPLLCTGLFCVQHACCKPEFGRSVTAMQAGGVRVGGLLDG